MPSDTYAQRGSFDQLSFRNTEMENIAHNIEMIACFEQELESTSLVGVI